RYSVAAEAASKPVEVRAYADRIVVRLDGEIVAEHDRHFGRAKVFTNFLHFVPVVARKPGALRNGLPFRDEALPPVLAEVRARLGKTDDGDRQFAGILAAILDFGLEAVLAACRQALDQGPCSKDVILTLLARQQDPEPVAPLPTAPALTIEPLANCARYDLLRPSQREAIHVGA
ncbi:MAG: IS21 family transposase, partial [Magnetococcales bacterium]|nr:IS21 family transposase [Magnetococcales bacterium]